MASRDNPHPQLDGYFKTLQFRSETHSSYAFYGCSVNLSRQQHVVLMYKTLNLQIFMDDDEVE